MPQSYADDLPPEYFTDAEVPRVLFKEALAKKELTKRILVIHGIGGIGKTSLLRIFSQDCKTAGIPVALSLDESRGLR